MIRRWSVLVALLILAAVLAAGAFAQISGDLIPSDDDWITIDKDYSSQRYVNLDQINSANVGKLKEVCEIQLNEPIPFSTGILKVGHTLYVNTARFTVAFDAATCAKRWQYTVEFVGHNVGNNNRGSAYLDGKIFRGAPDGQLIALNARTGEKLWSKETRKPGVDHRYETLVSAPIAWQGKVFIGIALGDLPITGRLMAFNAKNGDELWSFNTTLGENQGGGFWNSYSLDPKTGEIFAPVSNPRPDFNRNIEPDDSYNTQLTESIIAMNAATGQLDWYKTLVPRDDHDWDVGVPPTLYTVDGKEMLAATGKNGRVYGIDRTSQEVMFNTPATTMLNDQAPTTDKWLYVCPGVQGGALFVSTAYDPQTKLLYTGQNDHCSWYIRDQKYNPGLFGIGGYVVNDWAAAAKLEAPRGWITAIDGRTGAVRWRYHAEAPVQAGMAPTKSGLLFAGDTHGHLLIFNAASGSLIRSIDTGGALNSGLISYSVRGAQYVAATVGGTTRNASGVAGPLRVVIYGISAKGEPDVVTLPRLDLPPPPGRTANAQIFGQVCEQCHVGEPEFSVAQIARQSQLADPALLRKFLATVPPPMPRLYPGFINDNDVNMIAAYLREVIFKCGTADQPQSCEPPPTTTSGGTPAWRVIYADLTSPRCLNCHPVESKLPRFPQTVPPDESGYAQDYPRQDDDRHPHYFGVLRGDTFEFETPEGTGIVLPGEGPPFERCNSCHGTHNDPVTGIPGAAKLEEPGIPEKTFWFLAPALMAWESAPGIPLTGPELCHNLLNPALNGGRAAKDLLHHLQTEPLVTWSFHPGTKPNGQPRTTPPYNQEELVAAFEEWMAEGTPCPTD